MHRVNTFYRGELFLLETYSCPGQPESSRKEESAERFEIVLPRRGIYVRRNSRGKAVADANCALFFSPDQGYEISHPAIGGDLSTILALTEEGVASLLDGQDAESKENIARLLAGGKRRLTADMFSCHTWMLSRLALKEIDLLEIEETGLRLLDKVLTPEEQHAAKLEHKPSPDVIEAVQQAQIWLNLNYTGQVRLVDLARAVYLSPFHLSRHFHQITGFPVCRYLRGLRLAAALERMNSIRKICLTDLALELGFASLSHFSTTFKQHFNTGPAQYQSRLWSQRISSLEL